MVKRAVLWLRSNLQRRRMEREMRAEMAEHLDRATRLLMARGLTRDEARRQARRDFGDIAYHQTQARDARGTIWLDDLRADGRFALRHFARNPGTTILMLIVLAFGMSISTLLFSWVHGVSVLPPPGVTLEDDLVRIRGSVGQDDERSFSEDEFLAYRGLTGAFSAVAGWVERDGVLQVAGDVERRGHQADLMFVTDEYFQVLDIRPVLGAGLPVQAANDASASTAAVIDHQVWKELFGLRADVLGSVITINGVAFTIAGVAPDRFNGAGTHTGIQVWLPIAARHNVVPASDVRYNAIARLRPGVTREAATAAVKTIAARADTAAGNSPEARPSADVVPLLAVNSRPDFEESIRLMALMLGTLGSLVLLVTCTNVSALLTGLASARRQEIAVRLSLGAPRRRIIRQLLTESVALAAIGGAAALSIVALILEAAASMIPDMPLELEINRATTTFAFATALTVGILFGLSPALHATRLALAGVLRDSTRGIASSRARLQRGLVVAQVAFTQPLIVLMAAMILMMTTSMQPLTGSDYTDSVVMLQVQTPASIASDEESARTQREMMLRLREQVRWTPGVENAVLRWPQLYHPGVYTAHAADAAGGSAEVTAALAVQRVEGAHFAALGIPVTAGRPFNGGDVTAAEAASEAPVIVGADLAAHLWGDADPVGRRLAMTSDSASGNWSVPRVAGGLRTLVVVGVVDDPVARARLSKDPYRVYLPHDTMASAEHMLIRTVSAAAPLLPTIRGLVQQTATNAIIDARTMAEVEEGVNSTRRRVSGLYSAAGVVALLLSAIGLYAVISFSVTQRSQEIAVRLAVGARRSQIVYAFVRDGMRLGAFGLILGLPVGLLAMRQVAATTGMGDLPLAPIILIASTGIFLVAILSAWSPARRAAAVNPATTLTRG